MEKHTTHTPGPWSFYTKPQPNGCPIVGSRGLMVAIVAHSVNHADQKETALANASLISAAPELLACLKDARIALGRACNKSTSTGDLARFIPIMDEADAAIAKAEGRE